MIGSFTETQLFSAKERDDRIRLRSVKLLPHTSLTPRSQPNPGSMVRHLNHSIRPDGVSA